MGFVRDAPLAMIVVNVSSASLGGWALVVCCLEPQASGLIGDLLVTVVRNKSIHSSAMLSVVVLFDSPNGVTSSRRSRRSHRPRASSLCLSPLSYSALHDLTHCCLPPPSRLPDSRLNGFSCLSIAALIMRCRLARPRASYSMKLCTKSHHAAIL